MQQTPANLAKRRRSGRRLGRLHTPTVPDVMLYTDLDLLNGSVAL